MVCELYLDFKNAGANAALLDGQCNSVKNARQCPAHSKYPMTTYPSCHWGR